MNQHDLPADDLPADDLPADDLPADDLPADDLPADDLPADDLPADDGLTLAEFRSLTARVGGQVESVGPELLDEVAQLETLKHAISARQAVLAVKVDAWMRERAAGQGVPAERQGKGVGEAVAAARRTSPTHGRALVALAKHLRTLPATMARFRAGDLSEYKVTLITREASILDPVDQRAFDVRLAETPGLAGLGVTKVAHRAQAIAISLDEEAAVRRRERAAADRHVTIRPTNTGDGMARLVALLPVEQAAAVKEALEAAAATAMALGAPSTRGQVMADALVERITQGSGSGLSQPAHPVSLSLIMTDTALLDHDQTQPATLTGYGPIPNGVAKRLIEAAILDQHKVELRRLFTSPSPGELVAMEAQSRRFPTGLAAFVRLRDQLCRTPGCGARVAQIDHIHGYARGGPTSAVNAQGLCRQCNGAKEIIGNQPSLPPSLHEPALRLDLAFYGLAA